MDLTPARRVPKLPAILARAAVIALSISTTVLAGAPPDRAQAPAVTVKRAWDLGVVLEMRRPNRDGLEVLAVTPDGAAARIGLQRGDRIRSFNGHRLTGLGAVEAYGLALSNSGGDARLDILRAGSVLSLAGPLVSAPVEAITGCGYVTTLGPTPRLEEGIYSASLTMIDGDSPPLTPRNRYALPAGRRVLVLAEHIDDYRFSGAANVQRALMKRRLKARAYQALIVEVAPDTIYSIGARMLEDRLDSASIRDNAYWEPVVWKVAEARCR
jgi:hypothetical protein